MSKKARGGTPPPTADGDRPQTTAAQRVNVDEAMRRLAPYVFTVDTDTRETVDLKNTLAAIGRDPALQGNLLVVEKAEVCTWFCSLADPNLGPAIAEVKSQLPQLTEPGSNAGDSGILAQVVRHRIVQFAAEREEARLEEEEASRLRHEEFVDRLMEDGLTKTEAEKQAKEEEDAAQLNEDGSPNEVPRPVAYVLLKGFPFTVEQVLALAKIGIQLDSALILNCAAKFGRKDDPVSVDPKAKKKAPEPKKADAKKGKGLPEPSALPNESLAVQIRREVEKLPKFEPHPLKSVHEWIYDVPCSEGKLDDATGFRLYDLQESEADVADRLIQQIIHFETMAFNYREWLARKSVRSVSRITKLVTQGEAVPIKEPDSPAKKPVEPPLNPKPPAPAPKKAGKVPVKEEVPAPVEQVPQQPVLPPFPYTLSEITTDDELYRRLADEVAPGNLSLEVQAHCLLEQVQEACVTATNPSTNSSSAVADSIASKTRRDVADFCDFVLAKLDGTQDIVFEAARKKRLKAAEAMQSDDQTGDEDKVVPLAETDFFSLMPATNSKVEPDSLLLGVPLYKVEGRIRRALHRRLGSDQNAAFVNVRADLGSLQSLAEAHTLIKHVLMDRFGLHEGEVGSLLAQRTTAELLSNDAFFDRFGEIVRESDLNSSVIRVQCADGTSVIVVADSVPQERKTWRSTWETFHGFVSFPKWLAWSEHCAKENLFFHPPPRDDDDEDIVDQPMGAMDESEEEEEETDQDEEAAEASHADGDEEEATSAPKKKKKERKRDKLLPEFVNYDLQQTSELQRRAAFEHVQAKLSDHKAELLLANNYTANGAYTENSTLFVDDGCTICTTCSYINTRNVHCSVQTAMHSNTFGFRAHIVDQTAIDRAEREAAEKLATDTAAAALLAKETPRGEKKVPPKQQTQPQADAPLTPRDEDAKKKPLNTTPVPSGVNALLSIGDDIQFHVSATARNVEKEPIDAALLGEEDPAATTVESIMSTEMSCAIGGLTVTIAPSGSFHFQFEVPRDCPVSVYSPLTAQVIRIFTAELSRWVLSDGAVLSTFEDGTKMNMFPNGDTAVLHKGTWLITNAAGRRVLKQADGTVSPLIMSLVTTNTDVDTMSKITTREDGVVTVHYDDGRVLVQHIEGTRMWQDAHRTVVEIETEGLPLVCGTPRHRQNNCGALALKTNRGLVATLSAGEKLVVTHAPSSLSAVVDLRNHLLHVRPSEDNESRYVLDYAFGGLRAIDTTTSFHVTPFGRTRARPIADDAPVEILDDPPTRQIIDIFMVPEFVNENFARAAGRVLEESTPAQQVAEFQGTGFQLGTRKKTFRAHDLLHMVAAVPAPATWGHEGVGLPQPPRSRQFRDKERTTTQTLRSLIPRGQSGSWNQIRSPFIFVVTKHGVAELSRREDLNTYVTDSISGGSLLESDVSVEALPGTDNADHVVISIARPKVQVRPGIPKILLDLRAGGSSAPMGIPAFLQELKAGPAAGNTTCARDEFGAGVVVCSTRQFLRFSNVANQQTPLQVPKAGDPTFERALAKLAKGIPPVIATQMTAQRTAAIMAKGTNASTNVRTGSRGSRGGRRTKSNQKNTEDPEFQTQMETLAVEEKKRNPWPTPIQDRKEKVRVLQKQSTLNYWETLGKEAVEKCTVENELYKAANGYTKENIPHYQNPLAHVRVAEALVAKDEVDIAPKTNLSPQKPTAGVPRSVPTQPPEAMISEGKSLKEKTKAPRIVATPMQLQFGKVMEKHRYATTIHLTNIGGSACRLHVTTNSKNVIADQQKTAIAAGMSMSLVVELNGLQDFADSAFEVRVNSDGGRITIPVTFVTVSADRPLSRQTAGVRLLGPAKLAYQPGSVRRVQPPTTVDLDPASDEDDATKRAPAMRKKKLGQREEE